MHAIHRGFAHHTAEDGSFAASTSKLPVLQYYPCRGRAEPIRLALSYVGQEWFEPPPASLKQIVSLMHGEFDGYPFRQLPRFIDDGEVDLVQSQAIMRHLGRKYDLYGANMIEAGQIDMLMDGVLELRGKLRTLAVEQQFEAAARQRYEESVLAAEEELKKAGMQGPGLASFEYPLSRRRYSEAGWLVGGSPSIADFALFDLVDLHLDHLPDLIRTRFPALAAHHAKVAELKGVKEYLASENRYPLAFAADWVRAHWGTEPK
ncbi:hypothetical protein Agub_g3545 [Astrephomene gubernaculifera]|uniref:glutathione transferase n=1 Tax=Astrephomene gubernaculifera TaxID=47775 RepID=A0AAD3DIS4_9CHLO|nr:hypothetical protein Agub_g3545 [Astrephomene gubernaculifera]